MHGCQRDDRGVAHSRGMYNREVKVTPTGMQGGLDGVLLLTTSGGGPVIGRCECVWLILGCLQDVGG